MLAQLGGIHCHCMGLTDVYAGAQGAAQSALQYYGGIWHPVRESNSSFQVENLTS